MKKISAVFDGLDLTLSTLDYGIYFALKEKSMLFGLFPESFLYHGYRIGELLGKYGLSDVKIKHALEKDRKKRQTATELYIERCIAAGISYSTTHTTGITAEEILLESLYSDIMLIARNEHFSSSSSQRPSPLLRQLLVQAKCPLIVVPENFNKINRIVLLYDGKPSSVYAIRLFYLLLPALAKLDTELLHIAEPDEPLEFPASAHIRSLIDCHCPAAVSKIVEGRVESTLVSHLKQAGPGTLVVMGAYGRGAASRWLLPSTADGVINGADCPVFIAHQR